MQSPRVCIIDSGIGNLTSVSNALQFLNVEHEISSDAKALRAATHLVLPGVGSFGAGMAALKDKNLLDVLSDEVLNKKKNIFGICLGMQLLADKGFEYGQHQGLGFIGGQVVKIDTAQSKKKLPQIGWNNVIMRPRFKLTDGLPPEVDFYFVHSYHFVPSDPSVIAGVCEYSHDIVALIEKDNVMGAQFHPEKSHTDGLNLLKNFLRTAVTC